MRQIQDYSVIELVALTAVLEEDEDGDFEEALGFAYGDVVVELKERGEEL